MLKEKRTTERINIRVLVVFWELKDKKPVGVATKIHSKDISSKGISFETDRIYSIDSLFLAEIYFPGRKVPIVAILKAARIEAIVGKESYLIGASFFDIKQEDKDFIISSLKKMNLYAFINQALKLGASDLHLTVGRPPVVRTHGRIQYLKTNPVAPIEEEQVKAMMYPLLRADQIEYLEKNKELDFAFSPNINSRFRVNLHFQRGFLEATLRSIATFSRSFDELGLPKNAMERFSIEKSGLVLIAGTTGAGKTTTLASMIDHINKNLEKVVITIEDPIEFTHTSQKSIIKQRELGTDTVSYAVALKRSLRQDPDVIVVGELLDSECVVAALRAAETGHLVITTVHAPDAEQAVERIVNLFPPEHASTICRQLSSFLVGVLFQVLVPGKQNNLVLATELLIANQAVRNMIREKKFSQIRTCLQTGRKLGMYTLQNHLEELYNKELIDDEAMQEFTKAS